MRCLKQQAECQACRSLQKCECVCRYCQNAQIQAWSWPLGKYLRQLKCSQWLQTYYFKFFNRFNSVVNVLATLEKTTNAIPSSTMKIPRALLCSNGRNVQSKKCPVIKKLTIPSPAQNKKPIIAIHVRTWFDSRFLALSRLMKQYKHNAHAKMTPA